MAFRRTVNHIFLQKMLRNDPADVLSANFFGGKKKKIKKIIDCTFTTGKEG